MVMKVRVNGAEQTISAAKALVGGLERTLKTGKIQVAGELKTFAIFVPPLSLSITPDFASGTALSDTPVTISTNSVTAVPSGGEGPFTYFWTFVSQSGGGATTISNPSGAETFFQQDLVEKDDINSAIFRCTVTDTFGTTATSDITASFSNFGSLS